MSIAFQEYSIILLCFFFVAFLYSSIGFGGGSSYLALMALFLTSFYVIRSTALLCNLMVVSGSCLLFYKKGHLNFKKFIPFVATSIPMAFLGTSFQLKENVFFVILGISLICSAIALLLQALAKKKGLTQKEYPKYLTYVLGGAIGLLSGMVGIGGGIFLAPVLNHLRWDKPIVIAALASFFILVNSISGLTGLYINGSFEVLWPEILGLLLAVLIGGQLGVRMSIIKFSPNLIRIMTAVLVLFVGIRVLVNNGLQLSFFA